MNHTDLIQKTRAIHAVLDAAVPVVANNPNIVAVYAEKNPAADEWTARYETDDGWSFFGDPDAPRLLLPAPSYPGAIRFEACEVAEWPKIKAELSKELRCDDKNIGAAWFNGGAAGFWHPHSGHPIFDACVARGLVMFCEQLCDAGHDYDMLTERCKVCQKGMSDLAAQQPPTKREVELVWALPKKALQLPAGIKIKSQTGKELTLSEGANWNGTQFDPAVEARTSDGAVSYWFAPGAIGFPKPRPVPAGEYGRCAACDKKLEFDTAHNVIIGGVMSYQSCGCHELPRGEFLAMALGLVGPKLEQATIMGIKVPPGNPFAGTVRRANEEITKAILGQSIATSNKTIAGLPRYTASNLALEAEIAAKQAAKDAARARRVAVLGETLRQKVGARFPSPGRDDRVFSEQNPRFK